MVRVIINQGITTKLWMVSVQIIKNAACCFGIALYWLGLEDVPILDSHFVQFLIPQLIYLSTLLILII